MVHGLSGCSVIVAQRFEHCSRALLDTCVSFTLCLYVLCKATFSFHADEPALSEFLGLLSKKKLCFVIWLWFDDQTGRKVREAWLSNGRSHSRHSGPLYNLIWKHYLVADMLSRGELHSLYCKQAAGTRFSPYLAYKRPHGAQERPPSRNCRQTVYPKCYHI